MIDLYCYRTQNVKSVSTELRVIKEQSTKGFRNRATHNLWILLEEEKWIAAQLKSGEYQISYLSHLDNTIYRPLIKYLVEYGSAKLRKM